jgi:acetyl esterase/lipase
VWRRAAAALVAIGLAGCGTGRESARSPTPTPATTASEDYAPGLAADVHVPHRSVAGDAVPVVVLVPGGAWMTADRTGLDPLARELAEQGMFVVNATYRAASDGVEFPAPVADIACAVGFAVARAETTGLGPGPVVLVGHSSGAHLAALAALRDDHHRRADCAHPAATIDGYVGLAGVYDVSQAAEAAEPLFGVGPGDDPQRWAAGNPLEWVDARPSLPVLLAHGDADDLVPTFFTRRFADALRAAGHPVTVVIVPNADHHDLYDASVVAVPITRWITLLSAHDR